MTFNSKISALLITALLGCSAVPPLRAAEQEQDLIATLKSDAPRADKAVVCKKLAVYGSKDAVPALAPLLLDPELTSWARTALEAIPDPAASAALREALTKANGRVLIGIINSLGVKRDTQAISGLTEKLRGTDTDVAAAAAEALGNIGGDQVAAALTQALTDQRALVRSSAAYGSVVCAEQYLKDGNATAAVSLYDKVRQANLPKQRVLEATRGAILARKSDGIPLLLEQLRSPDMGLFGVGVRTARELPGRDVTQALAKELDQAGADRQVPILLALSDRGDAAVLPKLLQVAENSSKNTRLTALGLLDRFQDLACVPVLLNGATDSDPEIARVGKTGLQRLGGKEVDADLLARLRLAEGKTRQVLIELAGQRRIASAVPLVMRGTEDSNPAIRRASLEAIGSLGTEQQAGEIIRLLSATQNPDEREDIERALSGICRRSGAKSLPEVLPLAQSGNATQRKVGLRALSSIGGPDALGVIQKAVSDSDVAVQDEAVNLLSTWPNTWPEDGGVAEPLLTLAKTGKKPSYRVQALRGYLQYLEENKKLSNPDKVTKIKELLPSVQSAEEKQQVISVLGTLPVPASLSVLSDMAEDNSVSEEAYISMLKVATDRKMRDTSKDLRKQSLEAVAQNAKDDATKQKAASELKKLQ